MVVDEEGAVVVVVGSVEVDVVDEPFAGGEVVVVVEEPPDELVPPPAGDDPPFDGGVVDFGVVFAAFSSMRACLMSLATDFMSL